jgi:uncharacterized SAM-binding protein YcdF (DUF218 family)
MKIPLRFLWRLARRAVWLAGGLALLAAAAQFTSLPWRAYRRLAECPNPSSRVPTHILVMGGSGIPGESGLMRTFYGAQAAGTHPDAEVWVAMPLEADASAASRAYLDELRLRGVAPERLRILPQGRNTREQALRLAARLGSETNSAVVLIVSDPSHIRRTAASLRKAGVAHLAALPAHPLSIEDPLPWRAAELEIHSCSAPAESCPPAARRLVPDIGASLRLRYNLWANLDYSSQSLREYTALLYYRLRGWI